MPQVFNGIGRNGELQNMDVTPRDNHITTDAKFNRTLYMQGIKPWTLLTYRIKINDFPNILHIRYHFMIKLHPYCGSSIHDYTVDRYL